MHGVIIDRSHLPMRRDLEIAQGLILRPIMVPRADQELLLAFRAFFAIICLEI